MNILNAGHSYIQLKKYNEAKKYIVKGMSLAKKAGDKQYINYDLAYGYQNLGSLYKNLAKYKKSTINYSKAYNLYKNVNDVSDAKYCLSMINKIKGKNKKIK